ncbi:MAG: hypothetical protein ABI317_00605 [Gaiellales bacterium]
MGWLIGRWSVVVWLGGKTELHNLILLSPRHHKLLHDHQTHTSGTGAQPTYTNHAGRAITPNQPQALPG